MTDDLDQELRAALTRTSDDARFAAALAVVQQALHAQMGTLHRLGTDEHLHLVAASPGIPEPVLAASRRIPLGKGIAGEAAATAKPVSLCNLQTDASGVARPGAKATGLGGSLCVPVFAGERVVGTLGVGWMGERTITEQETATLLGAGRVLAPALATAND
jgi:signal transduction protein with GAF and PtsI domain